MMFRGTGLYTVHVLFLWANTSGDTGSSFSYLQVGSDSSVLAVCSGVTLFSVVDSTVLSVVTSVIISVVDDISVDVTDEVVDEDVLVGSSW